MTRSTIDFGIDLGTTNSAIAMAKGTDVVVYRNNEGFEYTPSAVWIDKNNRLFVGRQAKERLDEDPENAFAEFKLQMGTSREYCFARSGRRMKPELLSAEVLKSLKADVRQRTGEEVTAAVITVPAAFELPQCEATIKAAREAGLTLSPLLQEPVAAATAYGFQSDSDNVFWLVFDLGGGTFDAAVIRVREGLIQVVNHGGDNHLGGKLIDWAIVEQLFIPALIREHPLTDFRRGNAKWVQAIAKLKLQAEEGKIRVSRDDSTEIAIDFLCLDDRGQPVRFEYELKRADVERLAEPFILRAINICKQTLSAHRLNAGDVEKVLLVGGPSLMPYLRQRLADRVEGLGIPLEYSVDPLTVVAHGAAIFAGAQRLTRDRSELEGIRSQGTYTISFPEWRFTGSDDEPIAAGVVRAPDKRSTQGLTVEFINSDARPPWRSGKIGLAANGAFMTSLHATRGRANAFQIELCDSAGRVLECVTDPPTLTYTIGIVIESPPLTHSVGVSLVNNEVEWFLKKGTPLPARSRNVLRTAVAVRQGQAGDVIRIPVIEGKNERADRNKKIGELEIAASRVRRDVPEGSEVEFTIEINASREVRTRAYITILDEEYEEVLHLDGSDEHTPQQLQKDLELERTRLAEVRRQVEETNDSGARNALTRIDDERFVQEVETSIDAAAADADAADKGAKRLRELQEAMDDIEKSLEWPVLVAESKGLIDSARDVVNEHGNADDRRALQPYIDQVNGAIKARDADLLRQAIEELRGLAIRALDRKGILQVMFFQQLSDRVNEMRVQSQARQLVNQGMRAIEADNPSVLRSVNQQLAELLPDRPVAPMLGSTMQRGKSR